jgi:hypothetical protein
MDGTFQPGSDRHRKLHQLAMLSRQRPGLVHRAAKLIIHLPDLREGSFEVLVSRWQSNHGTSFSAHDFFDLKPVFCVRSTHHPSRTELSDQCKNAAPVFSNLGKAPTSIEDKCSETRGLGFAQKPKQRIYEARK